MALKFYTSVAKGLILKFKDFGGNSYVYRSYRGKTGNGGLFAPPPSWIGLKLIIRLRLGLSHLRFHKFKHNFEDTLNPICNCGNVEKTVHYPLYYPNFSNERLTLFNKFQSIDENILHEDDSNISKVLLFGEDSFDDVKSPSVLSASTDYVIATKHFDVPLYQNWHLSICLYAVYFGSCQEIPLIFMLFSFIFSILTIAYFRLFCKITCM